MLKSSALMGITLLFFTCMVGVLSTFTAESQASTVLLEQDFQSPVGGMPDDWNAYWRGGTAPDDLSHSEIRAWVGADDHTPEYGWTNERISGLNENAQIIYEGENSIFSNFEGELLMQYNMRGSSRATQLGVIVRVQEDGKEYQSTGGYFIGMLPRSADEKPLAIVKDPVGHGAIGGELLAVDEENFQLAGTTLHKLWFSLQGNTISARMYLWDDTAEDFELLSELSYTDEDSPYTSGLIGLRAGHENTNMTAGAQFANLTIIPEPGSLLLLGLAGLALLHRRRF